MKVMDNRVRRFFATAAFIFSLSLIVSCGKDDDSGPSEDGLSGVTFSVPVLSYASADTIGNIVFQEHVSGAVTVEVSLTGAATLSGGLHSESGLESGGLLAELAAFDGVAGNSSTYLQQLASGSSITYTEMLALDGHVKVSDAAGAPLGFADLGPNALTGEQTQYDLFPVSDPSISGTITFYQRENNAAIIAVRMNNVEASANHPSHIHNNTTIESGTIAVDLTSVRGETGTALTHVEKRNDGAAITYDNLLVFNGYVAVHKSNAEISTLVGQGDIGKNAFTGREIQYTLSPQSNPNISGEVLFQERNDGSTLVTIAMEGTQSGNSHPAHIHENTAAESGGIIISFNNVAGSSGLSKTNIVANNAGSPITYSDLLTINGYINVHASDADLSTLIAQTDVGQNALTGEQVVYEIAEAGGSGITGTLSVFERENGFSLAIVEIAGNLTENSYSSVIYRGNADTANPVELIFLRSIGVSRTGINNIKADRSGAELTYEELIGSDAHIRILKSSIDIATTVAIANIGTNSSARSARVSKAAVSKQVQMKLDGAVATCN